MTASVIGKQITWSASRDDEGYRNYKITHLVKSDVLDGPQVVMGASGLPTTGSAWNFDNDLDPWAFCLPALSVSIHKEKKGDKNRYWLVENTFSSKPQDRCQDETIEDPLLEPQKVSGSFVKYTEEAVKDRFGEHIQSSSHEQIRGPQVEFDANRPDVHIGQNVANLELDVFSEMVDTVNDAPLWGLGIRRIKLSNVAWERKLYGLCNFYYTRSLSFDINFDTFDRIIRDEGTKVLPGKWINVKTNPTWEAEAGMDKDNPSIFVRFKDSRGEIARVILDGVGNPATSLLQTGTGSLTDAGEIDVEYYPESNFLLLGIPISL